MRIAILIGCLLLLVQEPLLARPSISLGTSYEQANRSIGVSQLYASIGAAASKTLSLSFTQSALQYSRVDEDDPEFELNDSLVRLSYNPISALKNLRASFSGSATLPVSNYSRRHNIYSQLGVSGSLHASAFSWFSAYLSLGLRQYLSEYDSENPEENGIGRALPSHGYSLSHGSQIDFGGGLFFGYSISQSETFYHSIADASPTAQSLVASDQFFSVSAELGWSVSNLQLAIGYSQGRLLERPGLQDYIFYDEDASRHYLSLAASL